MALNDIKVPKENASGTFDEVVLTPSDIGAQSIFVTEALGTITANVTLTAARAKIYTVNTATSGLRILLPTTGVMAGDVVIIEFNSSTGQTLTPMRGSISSGFFTSDLRFSDRATFIAASNSGSSWYEDRAISRFDAQAIVSGTVDVARLPVGTGSTQVAAGNHTHVVADVTGAAASGSITTSGLTQATARILGRTSASTGAVEEITVGSGLSLSAGELSATSSGGVTAVGASTADVLSVSGSDLVADDPNADRIVFWDDSEGKLRYLEAGSGLSLSGTTMTATATGTIGGGTGSTDNSILRSDGTGGSTLQNSAFVIADNATASPNNTVNHASIQATGGSTNVSVSIVPKGTGAFMLQVPNAAAGGGNARGSNAVDLMTARSAATQVASGDNAVLTGGVNNTASGTQSVVCGGSGNTASGFQAAVFGGRNNNASNDRSICFGDSNTASQANSIAIGSSNTSSNTASLALGQSTTASAANATSVGLSSRADRVALFSHAGGQFAANGDAQRIRAVLRCKTTTNAAVEMALDGGTTYLTIPSGKVIFCNIKVVGVSSTGATVATFERQYAAKNVGGTSSEVFAAVAIGTDNAAGTSLEVATVDAGDYIRVRPTGLSATIFRWTASVDAVEVAYGT
jgi:hypothetical protein